MEIVLLILVLVGVAFIIYKASSTSKITSQQRADAGEAQEKKQFLSTMRTVFSGAKTRKQQDDFLSSQQTRLVKFLRDYEFKKEYDKILDEFRIK